MQIDIDFDVFKALTSLREREADSYNDVMRRLLRLSESEPPRDAQQDQLTATGLDRVVAALLGTENGAWLGNVFLPDGTLLRATYKGRTHRAKIDNEVWIDETGVTRQSPSEAAGAISGTNVNGWKFWYAKRPMDEDWQRLDELRK